jgi:hypothetical protein
LKVKGKLTNRYLASANFVEVTINVVRKTQSITWNPVATEIFAGNPVGGDFLNATAGAAVTPTYAYSGGALTAADKLPVGPHEVTATAAETATHAAASKTVTITVKLNPQTITWEPKVTEIFAGNAVGGDFLNATAGAGVTPTYAYSGGALTAADKLPAGPHEVTARAGETALYAEAQSKTATINVKLNPQTITWEPKVTEIPVGTLLGDDFLNASAAPGVTPVYEYQGAPFDAANPLPAGTHEITATAGITALYAAADPVKKSVTVLAKAEETK